MLCHSVRSCLSPDCRSIRGARTHNLRNIDLELPRDKLIVFTGLSGSGKSSLAFDTIYAEGQRRYVESLSAYARQFLSMMEKPDVDSIDGLSPAIAIEQKSTSHNARSTVGTVTEIYDHLRLLFARVGTPRCPDHHVDLEAQTIEEDLNHARAHAHLDTLADVLVGHGVVRVLDLDVIVGMDFGELPLRVLVRARRQCGECRPIQLNEARAARTSSFWNGRSFSSISNASMAALSSASEKNWRLRRRARIQRSTICTPVSTFDLSRGLRTRAGRIATP